MEDEKRREKEVMHRDNLTIIPDVNNVGPSKDEKGERRPRDSNRIQMKQRLRSLELLEPDEIPSDANWTNETLTKLTKLFSNLV